MIRLNMHEAKTHLSKYIARLKVGDVIVLCRRNVPVAEIRALPERSSEPRQFGGSEGLFEVTDAFLEPLPKQLLEGFTNPR